MEELLAATSSEERVAPLRRAQGARPSVQAPIAIASVAFRVGGVAPIGRGFPPQPGHQRPPLHRRLAGHSGQLQHRREEIQALDQGGALARHDSRAGGQKRGADAGIVVPRSLEGEPVVTEHVAVVGGEEHHGAVVQAPRRQRGEHTAHLVVDERHRGEVVGADLPPGGLIKAGEQLANADTPEKRRRSRVFRPRRWDRGRHLCGINAAQVGGRGIIRVVRIDEGDGEEERLGGGLEVGAGTVADPAGLAVLLRHHRGPGERRHCLRRVLGAGGLHAREQVDPLRTVLPQTRHRPHRRQCLLVAVGMRARHPIEPVSRADIFGDLGHVEAVLAHVVVRRAVVALQVELAEAGGVHPRALQHLREGRAVGAQLVAVHQHAVDA